jgi:hypothetical protein
MRKLDHNYVVKLRNIAAPVNMNITKLSDPILPVFDLTAAVIEAISAVAVLAVLLDAELPVDVTTEVADGLRETTDVVVVVDVFELTAKMD